jgi:hypothetical protein
VGSYGIYELDLSNGLGFINSFQIHSIGPVTGEQYKQILLDVIYETFS